MDVALNQCQIARLGFQPFNRVTQRRIAHKTMDALTAGAARNKHKTLALRTNNHCASAPIIKYVQLDQIAILVPVALEVIVILLSNIFIHCTDKVT